MKGNARVPPRVRGPGCPVSDAPRRAVDGGRGGGMVSTPDVIAGDVAG